ncbi:MAG: DNA-3-methyladenine glycosylase 2 family protein [Gammaproteobacteria bacterium AqS3]|nr:DNA-3-methyladenine glycosylase 2 family protein [Gammaproteobacteria bacterium AqS3]
MAQSRRRIPRLTRAKLPEALADLARADPDLRELTRLEVELPPPRSRPDGFAGLIHIIVEQQVSVAAGQSMIRSLREGVGEFTPENFLRFSPEQLRRFSLSGQKAGYCHGLAEAVAADVLDLDALPGLEDDAVRERLCGIKGIGRWSADIYLLGHLRRCDVMASGDLALQAAVQDIKNLPDRPDARQLDEIALAWSPWRSVAARLLWQHYRNLRGTA